MLNVLQLQADARAFLSRQLAIAKGTGQSVADAVRTISARFADFGLDNGFMPDDVQIASDFSSITAEVIFADYKTEATITA